MPCSLALVLHVSQLVDRRSAETEHLVSVNRQSLQQCEDGPYSDHDGVRQQCLEGNAHDALSLPGKLLAHRKIWSIVALNTLLRAVSRQDSGCCRI